MLQERTQQVRTKIAELTLQANRLYGITLPQIRIRFDLRGRAAGMAGRDRQGYYVRFNTDMMQNQAWDHLIKDTVPHELAHIVCFFNPQLGRNHNPGWSRVCRQLGGSGQRCHKEEVTYANGKTYYYTSSTGQTVTLSIQRHRKIQQGTIYRFKYGKGTVDRNCSWTTQQPAANQPVLQRAAHAPAAPTVNALQAKTGVSKADQVRIKIRELKAQVGSEGYERTIQWAVDNLGMTRSLATSYVKNNWNKA